MKKLLAVLLLSVTLFAQSPDLLLGWNGAVSDAISGHRGAVIAFFGDSNTAGVGADPHLGFVDQFRSRLMQNFADGGAGFRQMDYSWPVSGTWDPSYMWGASGYGVMAGTPRCGVGPATMLIPAPPYMAYWKSLDINYISTPVTTGTFTVAVDGGTPASYSAGTTGTPTWQRVRITASTLSTHSATINVPAASVACLQGVSFNTELTNAIQVHRYGQSGSVVLDWTKDNGNPYKGIGWVGQMPQLDAYVIALGTNDYNLGTLAAWSNGISAFTTAMRTYWPHASCVLMDMQNQQGATDGGGDGHTRADFYAATQAVVTANDCHYINIGDGVGTQKGWGSWANANDKGLMAAGSTGFLHPSTRGAGLIAENLFKALLPNSWMGIAGPQWAKVHMTATQPNDNWYIGTQTTSARIALGTAVSSTATVDTCTAGYDNINGGTPTNPIVLHVENAGAPLNGKAVTIAQSTGAWGALINGSYTSTRVDASHFSIPVDGTSLPTFNATSLATGQPILFTPNGPGSVWNCDRATDKRGTVRIANSGSDGMAGATVFTVLFGSPWVNTSQCGIFSINQSAPLQLDTNGALLAAFKIADATVFKGGLYNYMCEGMQ